MLKKSLIFGTIFLTMINLSCAQEENQQDIKLIDEFLQVLFDENIPSLKVVDQYIYSKKYKLDAPKDSIVDGTKIASEHIKMIRKEVEKDNGWLLPNKKVASLKTRNIYPLSNYTSLDKLGMSDKEEVKYMYVLLNSDKSEILEYFYVKEKKIYSFTLLVKSNSGYFYQYHG